MNTLSKKVGFPTEWEELTKRELIYLLKLFIVLQQGKGLSLQDLKRAFTAQVFSWRGIRKEKTVDYMLLVDGASKTLDWAISYDEEAHAAVMHYDCIACLIREFGRFHGPVSYGGDISFGEFRHLLMLYNDLSENNNESALDRMAGVLYRPVDKKTGRHVLFDVDADYSAIGHRMPEWLRYYAYLWFTAFSRYLMTGDFIVDGNAVNFSKIFASSDDSVPDNFIGMNSILFSVAESHVFGAAKDVDNTYLFRILLKLVDDGNKADELMKMYKSHD